MPSLTPDYQLYIKEANRLLNLSKNILNLNPIYQKFVAEIILLRLFSLFENFISCTSFKIASGAYYLDGTIPNLVFPATSIEKARILFLTHGRSKPLYYLNWATAKEIKSNISNVIDNGDNIISVVDRNGNLIDEIRRIRNRIAHNNATSRKNYKIVIRRYYGANLNNISPGTLLLTQRYNPNLLNQYISRTIIFVKNIVKA